MHGSAHKDCSSAQPFPVISNVPEQTPPALKKVDKLITSREFRDSFGRKFWL